jgi:hypothetical protein
LELQDKGETSTGGAPAIAEEGAWRCAACGHEIARDRDRVDLEGAAERAFVNPEGIEFVIIGFRDAPGCRPFGASSTYWSWFEGFAWRVALCGGCGAHLGWSFESGARRFHGLIVRRLAPP